MGSIMLWSGYSIDKVRNECHFYSFLLLLPSNIIHHSIFVKWTTTKASSTVCLYLHVGMDFTTVSSTTVLVVVSGEITFTRKHTTAFYSTLIIFITLYQYLLNAWNGT